MDREQIEKWALEAEEYAQDNGSADEPHYTVFNRHFARLVRAAALEEAANECEEQGARKVARWERLGENNMIKCAKAEAWTLTVAAQAIRALAEKEPKP